MPNVHLTKDTGQQLNLPAGSILSIEAVTNRRPEDRIAANSLIHYDFGTGLRGAWLLDEAHEVQEKVVAAAPEPAPWVALSGVKDSAIYFLAGAFVASEGLTDEEAEQFGDAAVKAKVTFRLGYEFRDAYVTDTSDEIDARLKMATDGVSKKGKR